MVAHVEFTAVDVGCQGFSFGNQLGLRPVDEVGKIGVAADIDLGGLYQMSAAPLEHLEQ
jgi:hypothetical protein